MGELAASQDRHLSPADTTVVLSVQLAALFYQAGRVFVWVNICGAQALGAVLWEGLCLEQSLDVDYTLTYKYALELNSSAARWAAGS